MVLRAKSASQLGVCNASCASGVDALLQTEVSQRQDSLLPLPLPQEGDEGGGQNAHSLAEHPAQLGFLLDTTEDLVVELTDRVRRQEEPLPCPVSGDLPPALSLWAEPTNPIFHQSAPHAANIPPSPLPTEVDLKHLPTNVPLPAGMIVVEGDGSPPPSRFSVLCPSFFHSCANKRVWEFLPP